MYIWLNFVFEDPQDPIFRIAPFKKLMWGGIAGAFSGFVVGNFYLLIKEHLTKYKIWISMIFKFWFDNKILLMID
jgi:hypothetical protein